MIRILGELIDANRGIGDLKVAFDRVLIETTGLTGTRCEDIFVDEEMEEFHLLDAIVRS